MSGYNNTDCGCGSTQTGSTTRTHGRTRRVRNKRQTGATTEDGIEVDKVALANMAVEAAVTGIVSSIAVKAVIDRDK